MLLHRIYTVNVVDVRQFAYLSLYDWGDRFMMVGQLAMCTSWEEDVRARYQRFAYQRRQQHKCRRIPNVATSGVP